MQYCIVDKNAVYFDNVHSYNDHNTLNTILIHEYNTERNDYYINRFVAMFHESIAGPYAGGFDGTPYFCSLKLILSLNIKY